MGRKKEIGTPVGNEKQQSILDAAAAVFMKLGFAGASLDDVNDNYGGTSKGIIYYHFRSKTKLFFAVQRRAMELTRETIVGIAQGSGSPREKLEQMAFAHTLMMMEHLDYLRVAAQGLEMHLSGRTTEEERLEIASITALRDSNEKLYTDVLNAGVKSGQFRRVDSRIAVKPLLGALNWTSRWYHPRIDETRAEREHLAKEIAQFAIHAFLPEQNLKATLNKSPRAGTPAVGMGCEAQSAAIPVGIASICNDADRPNAGCASRAGLVQRCLKSIS